MSRVVNGEILKISGENKILFYLGIVFVGKEKSEIEKEVFSVK